MKKKTKRIIIPRKTKLDIVNHYNEYGYAYTLETFGSVAKSVYVYAAELGIKLNSKTYLYINDKTKTKMAKYLLKFGRLAFESKYKMRSGDIVKFIKAKGITKEDAI